jgi:hypothetical protein
MQLFFLIPLITGVLTSYIFQKSADEMAYLTGVVTIVSFIFSIVLAPWQIQLVILALVITTTRRRLLQNEYRIQSDYTRENKIE